MDEDVVKPGGGAAGAWALLLASALVSACTAPRIVEDSGAACSNGVDDDGDGLTDCADPACASSGACELSAAACSNGIDDDRDGRTDCEQTSCVDLGFCAPVAADCDVPSNAGCVRGMSCQSVDPSGEQRVCAKTGEVNEGRECTGSASDPAGGCKAGLTCAPIGLCERPCGANTECPRSSVCIRLPDQRSGFCSDTCLPSIGCRAGYLCAAFQRVQVAYADRGWMHACFVASTAAKLIPPGAAKSGATCVDPAFASTPAASVCEPGLLCVPGPVTNACREVCIANDDGGTTTTTCPSGRCVAVDPFDPRPPRSTEPYRLGVCLP
jgi:hypothetical protein